METGDNQTKIFYEEKRLIAVFFIDWCFDLLSINFFPGTGATYLLQPIQPYENIVMGHHIEI